MKGVCQRPYNQALKMSIGKTVDQLRLKISSLVMVFNRLYKGVQTKYILRRTTWYIFKNYFKNVIFRIGTVVKLKGSFIYG